MHHSELTTGATDAVWLQKDPYKNRPTFSPLKSDIETGVCVIGSGIAGISTAYELVKRGREVTMLEARTILSGETGRTSGHLANALDDHYIEIEKKHGREGAKQAADSHSWAIKRVGEIAKELGIDCNYRLVPGYELSQFDRKTESSKHQKDMDDLKSEVKLAQELGIEAEFSDDLTVKGWDSTKHDQSGGAIFRNQGGFHPTLYLNGIMNWLSKQRNFKCYTDTRVMSVSEESGGNKLVKVETANGNTVLCDDAVEATVVPLQKLSVIVQMGWYRTYCVAIRIPKGSVEDCFIYDSAEMYKYIRLTPADDKDDYLIVGGCDHKVGQEETSGRFEELEAWTRERFPQAGATDYKWSGQVYEPHDYMAFIGKNQGNEHIYIVTGDSGNGMTHGVLAGKLLSDLIEGKPNPWESTYSPKRVASMVKSAPEMLKSDIQVNLQYKKVFHSDITDIEDLVPGSGGIMTEGMSKVAVYKDESGAVSKMSAICPHLKGVVCWNALEKSFDCPVHGSRFSTEGKCLIGPAKAGLSPVEA